MPQLPSYKNVNFIVDGSGDRHVCAIKVNTTDYCVNCRVLVDTMHFYSKKINDSEMTLMTRYIQQKIMNEPDKDVLAIEDYLYRPQDNAVYQFPERPTRRPKGGIILCEYSKHPVQVDLVQLHTNLSKPTHERILTGTLKAKFPSITTPKNQLWVDKTIHYTTVDYQQTSAIIFTIDEPANNAYVCTVRWPGDKHTTFPYNLYYSLIVPN